MRRFLLLKQIYIFVEKNFSFMKKIILAFLIALPMIGIAQIEIKEENDKLIINDEKIIEKGSVLIITEKLFQNMKKLHYKASPKGAIYIQSPQSSFTSFFKPVNDTSLIGEKVKVLRFSKKKVVVSINMVPIPPLNAPKTTIPPVLFANCS